MVLALVFALLSMGCLLYYVVILLYAGLAASFAQFWLLSGVLWAVMAVLRIRWLWHPDKRWPLFIRVFLHTTLIMGLVILLIVGGVILHAAGSSAPKNLDYVIVLGARVYDKTPSPLYQKRLDAAVAYLEANPGTKVVVTGGMGNGEKISEGEAGANYLMEQGVDKDRILIENQSDNTYQNLRYALRLIGTRENLGIITNDFHVYRALAIARKTGLKNVSAISAEGDAVLFVNNVVREVFATFKAFTLGNI